VSVRNGHHPTPRTDTTGGVCNPLNTARVVALGLAGLIVQGCGSNPSPMPAASGAAGSVATTGGSGGNLSSGGSGGGGTTGGSGGTAGGSGGATGSGGALTGGSGGQMGGSGGLVSGGSGGVTGGSGGATGGGGSSSGGGGATGGSGGATGGSSGATGGSGGATGGAAGAGGSAGATGGAGGSFAYGFAPTTVTAADAADAYAYWKDNYLEDCGGGVYRVRWDDPSLTVSEGIGYGMLMAVSLDDRAVFDGLWAYYTANVNEHGVMHWQRGGCAGTQPSQNSNNGATDAELDAAMALLMANCRWSDASYLTDAEALISAIRNYETSSSGGLYLLNPGDTFGGADCLNASYFSPGYYRAFAEHAATQSERDFWNQLAADSYTLIDRMAHASTGLVPNWADMSGNTGPQGPSGCAWYDEADIYGSDAARTPWRIAVDYIWWGTPEAKSWLDRVTDWVKTQGITTVGRKYQLDGTAYGALDHSVISIGAWANGAVSYDQATADEFTAELVAVDDHGYFPDSLRVLYLLVASGRFTTCGGL
jgi:endo-1,4-beta-D-glucanase Y